mgnify:CR=1 FL=1
MNAKIHLLGLLMVLCGLSARAQEIRENEHGETIVVYQDGSWRYFNEDLIRSPGEYPVAQADVSPLDNPVRLTEDVARKIAYRQEQMAEEARAIAERRVEEARQQRQRIEQELQQMRNEADPESLRRLNIRLYAARETEQNAQREVVLAHNELNAARDLRAKGNILEAFKMRQKQRSERIDLPETTNMSPDFLSAFDPVADFYLSRRNDLSTTVVPPENTCSYAFDGVDEASGQRRRDMPKRLLFTHTDDRLRLFMKEKDYLRCEGYLTSIAGGYRFLTLEFTFAYPNAKEAYGFIEKGSILTIKLLNGDFVNLKSGTMDQGSYDIDSQVLTYRVMYPIDQSLLTFLRKSEVDAIRVFWSSGYEEYEVYELDFFMEQIACLDR